MAENSKISWTDHTFNIAWGCEEVSPACDHCYAKSFARSVGQNVWNENPRRVFGDKHWNEPLKWNKKAADAGKNSYVFCSSMCDIFEVHPTIQQELKKLPSLVDRTPFLTWLLLTKRALEIRKHPELTRQNNVLMGVTMESMSYDWRANEHVQWLSVEPMLGPVVISKMPLLKWVIIGGESGHGAREMHLDWAKELIAECRDRKVAVHFKQTGDVLARKLGLKDRSGKNPAEWPAELRIQEFPQPAEVTDAH